MDGITIEINATAAIARLQGVPAKLKPALSPALQKAGYTVQTAAAANMGEGEILGVRSGTTRRALFTSPVIETSDGLEVHVGVDLAKAPGARIQEFGGTITPKKAAHLAIPLSAMLTPNGVAKGTAKDVISNPQAFGYADTFAAKGVIFGTLGKTGTGKPAIVPLFALKDRVVLPARPYLRTALQTSAPAIVQQLAAAVDGVLGG